MAQENSNQGSQSLISREETITQPLKANRGTAPPKSDMGNAQLKVDLGTDPSKLKAILSSKLKAILSVWLDLLLSTSQKLKPLFGEFIIFAVYIILDTYILRLINWAFPDLPILFYKALELASFAVIMIHFLKNCYMRIKCWGKKE